MLSSLLIFSAHADVQPGCPVQQLLDLYGIPSISADDRASLLGEDGCPDDVCAPGTRVAVGVEFLESYRDQDQDHNVATYQCSDDVWIDVAPWDEGTHELRKHFGGALLGVSSSDARQERGTGHVIFVEESLLISSTGSSHPQLLPYPRMIPNLEFGSEFPVRLIRKKAQPTASIGLLWEEVEPSDPLVYAWLYYGKARVYETTGADFHHPLTCVGDDVHAFYEFQNRDVFIEACFRSDSATVESITYLAQKCTLPGAQPGDSQPFFSVGSVPVNMNIFQNYAIHSIMKREAAPRVYGSAPEVLTYPDPGAQSFTGWTPYTNPDWCP